MGANLYHGHVSYDFVGRRRVWYALSGVVLLLAIIGLGVRGLNLGIEFKGGAEFQLKTTAASVATARTAAANVGQPDAIVTLIGTDRVRVQTGAIDEPTSQKIAGALADAFHVSKGEVQVQLVGPTWGGDITTKAVQGLAIFIILVIVFLALYFEWKMAVAAMIALAHDIVITVGVYALSGFEVTPATVIGVLTILGYSLYDTVVVFDKVKENTRGIAGQSRRTYSGAANLALNQTLVRSINTSFVAIMPVAAILVIGAGLLGAGTLKDLALALFVGMIAGTYSSIFVATPVLAQLKETEPAMRAVAKRVAQRGGESTEVAVGTAATPGTGNGGPRTTAGPRVQPRRQPKRKR